MKGIELYAADSNGEYQLVEDASLVEHKHYMIQFPDGFKITGHSAFFKGAYEDAPRAWTNTNDSGIAYAARGDK